MSEVKEHPIRIQRKRTKGWTMPPNTVYVGRPTVFGNPFTGSPYMTRASRPEGSIRLYKMFIRKRWMDLFRTGCRYEFLAYLKERRVRLDQQLGHLRGKNLACWCPLDQPCHADVLLEIANKEQVKP